MGIWGLGFRVMVWKYSNLCMLPTFDTNMYLTQPTRRSPAATRRSSSRSPLGFRVQGLGFSVFLPTCSGNPKP